MKRIAKANSPRDAVDSFVVALQLARMLAEKCELAESRRLYEQTLARARSEQNVPAQVEAISGLIRLTAEALDEPGLAKLDEELDRLIHAHPQQMPATVWYAKGVSIARSQGDFKLARRHFLRFLRMCRAPENPSGPLNLLSREECVARAWGALATNSRDIGKLRRAEIIALGVLRDENSQGLGAVNAQVFHLLGRIAEKRRELEAALKWFREAQTAALGARNWYLYCYVLLSYAAVSRQQQAYAAAYQYLEMADKVANGPEFGSLRRAIDTERARLEEDAVDILIDSRKGIIETREGGTISLRKQYVLLSILEALSEAHDESAEGPRGLSKAEIISKVWREDYRPEAHDNKLYYNINRLRKLIEPDTRKPQYLLNWREGYRLAPGLKIRHLGAVDGGGKRRGGEQE